MVTIRPATAADLDGPFKSEKIRTARMWMVERDGPIAVMGFYIDQGRTVVFSQILPEARERCRWYARDVLKCSRFLLEKAKAMGMPIYAIADPTVGSSEKLLERIGFVQGNKETYVWAR